jgi:histidinol phosphatase-like enzyme
MTKDSISLRNKPIIALDCDGVLLDYCSNFARIYEQTFGKSVELVQPRSYHVSLILFTQQSSILRQSSRENDMELLLLKKKKFNLKKFGMNRDGEQCQCMMEHSKLVFFCIKLDMN